MTPDQIRIYGAAIVVLTLVYWTLIFLLKPKDAANSSGSTYQSATTHGGGSPALTGDFRHANINLGSTQAQPPQPSSYTLDGMDGLMRIMSGGSVEPHQPGLARWVKEDRCPDFPAWQALAHIAQVIGDNDVAGYFAKSRIELRQAALDGRVQIWGRQGIRPAHLKAPLTCSEVWTKIPSGYWRDFRLNNNAAVDVSDALAHTDAEQHVSHDILAGKYWTLRVDKQAVEQNWRLPKEPPPSSSPPRDLGPNGWMAR